MSSKILLEKRLSFIDGFLNVKIPIAMGMTLATWFPNFIDWIRRSEVGEVEENPRYWVSYKGNSITVIGSSKLYSDIVNSKMKFIAVMLCFSVDEAYLIWKQGSIFLILILKHSMAHLTLLFVNFYS